MGGKQGQGGSSTSAPQEQQQFQPLPISSPPMQMPQQSGADYFDVLMSQMYDALKAKAAYDPNNMGDIGWQDYQPSDSTEGDSFGF